MKIVNAKWKYGTTEIEVNGETYYLWQHTETEKWYLTDGRNPITIENTKKECIQYLKENEETL